MRRSTDVPDQPAATARPAFTFTATAERRAGRSDAALGLECLARTMDQAALNVGLASLRAAEAAAREPDLRQAADAARRAADQVTSQLRSLELALAEALPAGR